MLMIHDTGLFLSLIECSRKFWGPIDQSLVEGFEEKRRVYRKERYRIKRQQKNTRAEEGHSSEEDRPEPNEQMEANNEFKMFLGAFLKHLWER